MNQNMINELNYDFNKLINLHYKVTHEMVGTIASKKKYWMGYEQIFSAKLINHIFSLFLLSKGTPIKFSKNEILIIDQSTIAIILRAIIETYLSFHYIYISPKKNINETKLRYLSWIYCDTTFINYFSSKTNEEKKIESDKILKTIEGISLYKMLRKDQKTAIANGDWKIKNSWSDLASFAGFKRESFHKVYKFLCSHSHTGSHSITQIKMVFEFEKEQQKTVTPLKIALVILSCFINDYCKMHQKARNVLNKEMEGKNLLSDYLTTYKDIYF